MGKVEIINIKKKDDMREYAGEKPVVEDKKSRVFKEMKMPRSLKERVQKRREKQLERLQQQHEYLEKKYGTQIKSEELKTRIAELKQARRQASPFSKVGRVFSKMRETGDGKTRLSRETVQFKTEQLRRAREVERRRMEEETEYHRKFPVKKEGEGELPYYEMEEGRKLPEKKIPPRKTMKEELIGGLDEAL
jgi:hypothetical protein